MFYSKGTNLNTFFSTVTLRVGAKMCCSYMILKYKKGYMDNMVEIVTLNLILKNGKIYVILLLNDPLDAFLCTQIQLVDCAF